MNRRKAIGRIILLTGGFAGAYAGFKGYHLLKKPELGKLKSYQELIDELAETIIPATDTPGAKEAGVGSFVSKMILECCSRKNQNNFLDGLEDLAGFAIIRYGKRYEKCSTDQKETILHHFERKGARYSGLIGKAQRVVMGDSFFSILKKYSILGYCTSKKGATEALAMDYVPGKYIGSVPLKPGQLGWAIY